MPGLYRKLTVWQKAVVLVENVYGLTNKFPTYETTNLVDQMRRSSLSIPANIAEGQYRFSKNQNKQFLRIAYGSCAELDTQITIAKKLGYLRTEEAEFAEGIIDEIMRMLNSMIKKKILTD
ncbi:MAG: hypothetical protein JW384_01984 [Nitrosomonadaceae bacterium]|nr:hypothetical protein [Nitrosomonadaceae bacterium]